MKKLRLSKKTISSLTHLESTKIAGGTDITDCLGHSNGCPPATYTCPTVNYSNCNGTCGDTCGVVTIGLTGAGSFQPDGCTGESLGCTQGPTTNDTTIYVCP